MDVTIRRAKQNDLRTIAQLAHELTVYEHKLQPISREFSQQHFMRKYREAMRKTTTCLLVAEVDGEVAGMLYGYTQKAQSWIRGHARTGMLDFCIVTARYRKQGIGKQLAHAFENWCSTKQVHYIELYVFSNNNARHVWQRIGYEERGIAMHKTLR